MSIKWILAVLAYVSIAWIGWIAGADVTWGAWIVGVMVLIGFKICELLEKILNEIKTTKEDYYGKFQLVEGRQINKGGKYCI